MNKEEILLNTKKHFKGNLLKRVIKQIDDYFEISNSNYLVNTSYKVGQDVVLDKHHLLHGIGIHNDVIDIISERGIVSLDYLGSCSNHGIIYAAAFWKVKEKIKLNDFIVNYSGIVAKVNDNYEQVPYGKLDEFVEKLKNVEHFLWTSESSMEIRFMPSLAKNVNQVGFILNLSSDKGRKLRENSIFTDNFKENEKFKFTRKSNQSTFKKNNFGNDFFDRAEYIIFGIPSNFIEGVLVGREYEKNTEKLDYIKSKLPNCYICNLDGKVIRE